MIKSTGIVRRVDELGRVVIPVELRRNLKISETDPLEIYVDNEKVILKKYQPGCIFCGTIDGVKTINGQNICQACLKTIKEMAG